MKLQLAFLAASAAIAQADLSLLKPVLSKMAERFTTRVTAVNNLWAGALAADTTNFDIWPLCCDSERLTEVFNNNYGCVVDMAVACIRGPCTHGKLDTNRTADMPSILGGTPTCANSVLGQSFYDACMKNTKDYDGTARQYYGSETGVFNMFPGGGVGYHCDNRATADTYDCRVRPWYKESVSALGTDNENSVQFSSPYLGKVGGVLMVTASRAVISAADSIFQGVVGLDMDMTYLMEPLADVNAADDSYAFVVDGNNNEVVSHPKLDDVRNFIENGKHPVMSSDVEPEKAVQDKLAEILGKDKGEFTIDVARYKTFRNDILDSEEATSATGFWSAGYTKENVQVSCTNLESSGAQIKYTICAVKISSNLQLHIVIPILLIVAIVGGLFVMKDKLGDGNQV